MILFSGLETEFTLVLSGPFSMVGAADSSLGTRVCLEPGPATAGL